MSAGLSERLICSSSSLRATAFSRSGSGFSTGLHPQRAQRTAFKHTVAAISSSTNALQAFTCRSIKLSHSGTYSFELHVKAIFTC